MRVYSTPGQFLSRLEGLDEPTLARLSSCGLDGFKRSLEATSRTEGSHVLVAALMEWWWDTTSSFHMLRGDITITPYDYAILTGLPLTNKVVAVDDSLKRFTPTVREMIGPVCSELGRSEHVRMITLASD